MNSPTNSFFLPLYIGASPQTGSETSLYGAGNDYVVFKDVDCDGSESSLLSCGYSGPGNYTDECGTAGVICEKSKVLCILW